MNLRIIRDAGDPSLQQGFTALQAYFGPRHEMEPFGHIQARLDRNGSDAGRAGDYLCHYEMAMLMDAGSNPIAVADYCVIGKKRRECDAGVEEPVVGFLSHIWIASSQRGNGLAREFHEQLVTVIERIANDMEGGAQDADVLLVAEAEHPDTSDQEKMRRLAFFRRLGYLPVDPASVDYRQPAFDDDATDANPTRSDSVPLLLLLLVRNPKPDGEETIAAARLHHVAESLYDMYGRDIPAQHMARARESLRDYPAAGESVGLDWGKVLTWGPERR